MCTRNSFRVGTSSTAAYIHRYYLPTGLRLTQLKLLKSDFVVPPLREILIFSPHSQKSRTKKVNTETYLKK
jgi:hypothetical protein